MMATEAAAPGTAPAAATPAAAPAAPPPDPIATARAKAVAAATAPPPAAAAPVTPPAAVAKPTIDMDAATLKRLTKLSREKREADARIAKLEKDGAPADATLREAKTLYAQGKRLEAIAKLSGGDATAEMESLMAAYLNTEAPGEKDEITQRMEALEKEQTAEKERRAKEEEAAKTTAEQVREANTQAFAIGVLDELKGADGAPAYALCALPANRAESAREAIKQAVGLAQARGITDLTPDVAKGLMKEAYAAIETEWETIGKERFTKPQGPTPQPSQGSRPPAPDTSRPLPPQIRPDPPRVGIEIKPPTSGSLTHDQAKAKAIAKALDAVRGPA